jgi:hypothetical protein
MLSYPCRIRLVFAYTGIVTCRVCIVSFMDPAGITHAVEVPASSLYEAAARAITEFRRCGFTEVAIGPATRLIVTVKAAASTHELPVSKLESWLNSSAKSPSERVLKDQLREMVQNTRAL